MQSEQELLDYSMGLARLKLKLARQKREEANVKCAEALSIINDNKRAAYERGLKVS